jgi:hypothetical protein
MRVEPQPYRRWTEAWRCTTDRCELVVVTSVGPRILSLRLDGGPNLLAEDSTGFGVGAWRLYGGHRFTTAPEDDSSYVPDNDPCTVELRDEGLLIQSAPAQGVPARTLLIQEGGDGDGFDLTQQLTSDGPKAWRGSPWAITCVAPGGVVVIPRDTGRAANSTGEVRFWHSDSPTHAGSGSPQWDIGGDHVVVRPSGQIGKIGLYSGRGWLAWLRRDCSFMVAVDKIASAPAYPDGGCNAEVYTSPAYVELEVLGPLTTLAPGESTSLVSHWRLTQRTYEPCQWQAFEDEVNRGSAYAR